MLSFHINFGVFPSRAHNGWRSRRDCSIRWYTCNVIFKTDLSKEKQLLWWDIGHPTPALANPNARNTTGRTYSTFGTNPPPCRQNGLVELKWTDKLYNTAILLKERKDGFRLHISGDSCIGEYKADLFHFSLYQSWRSRSRLYYFATVQNAFSRTQNNFGLYFQKRFVSLPQFSLMKCFAGVAMCCFIDLKLCRLIAFCF